MMKLILCLRIAWKVQVKLVITSKLKRLNLNNKTPRSKTLRVVKDWTTQTKYHRCCSVRLLLKGQKQSPLKLKDMLKSKIQNKSKYQISVLQRIIWSKDHKLKYSQSLQKITMNCKVNCKVHRLSTIIRLVKEFNFLFPQFLKIRFLHL